MKQKKRVNKKKLARKMLTKTERKTDPETGVKIPVYNSVAWVHRVASRFAKRLNTKNKNKEFKVENLKSQKVKK